MKPEIIERNSFSIARERIKNTPVLLIQGARSVGKSTLMRELAKTFNIKVYDFDDDEVRDFARMNAKVLVVGNKPIFIDEYQLEPKILNAIKAKLNQDGQFGQFVLSGSSSFDALPRTTQNLTGRLERMNIYPLSQAEILATGRNFISDFIKSPAKAFESYQNGGFSTTKREDYAKMMVQGGFPLALQQKDQKNRTKWFESYIKQALDRDTKQIAKIRNFDALEQIASKLAVYSGSVYNGAKIAQELNLNQNTTRDYVSLLEKIFFISKLPVNYSVGQHLVKHPKIHFVDSGILCHILGYDEQNILEIAPKTITNFGHIFESFIVQEVTRLCSFSNEMKGITYWRTQKNVEVDLILELWDSSLVAIEVKSGESIKKKDWQPMSTFRELAGDRFLGGIVINTGIAPMIQDANIYSLPADCLWR